MAHAHRPLQALIFDVDGTLAETEKDGHRPAFNAAFAEQGLDWHWDEQHYGDLLAVAGGKERIRHFVAQTHSELLAGEHFDALIHRLHRQKTAHYLARVAAGSLPLRPGVAETLRAARSLGIRLAIASTTTLDNVHALLNATLGPSASSWFDVIGAGDVVAAKKPDPAIYHWVLQKLDLPKSACLAIEDSRIGLLAARAAGLACLVTPSAYSAGQDFSGAAGVIEDLSVLSKNLVRRQKQVNQN